MSARSIGVPTRFIAPRASVSVVAEAGRALYDAQRPYYDASFAGRARGWWESIEEELR